ncbi:MAG: L-lactate permease [Spirochaetaceae bacterium]|nr:L-lactate permease [Spirochaetaceae bacterium]
MMHFLLSFLPLFILILFLGILKISPRYAAFFSLLSAIIIAVLFFNQNLFLIFMSLLEGVVFTLWPMLIVLFAALFSYNFIIETKRIDIIKKFITSFSEEKSVLVLILVWGFGNLLEGIAGYGTPVIIPAGIMIALGFNPFFSAFICLLANTVPSAYGAVGIPAITVSIITDLDPNIMSAFVASQLLPFAIVIPFILVLLTEKSFKKALKYLPETLAASLGFSISYFLVAFFLGPELPIIVGSLVVITLVIIVSSLRKKIGRTRFVDNKDIDSKNISSGEIINSFSVYFFVLILITLVSPLFPEIKNTLDSINSSIKFYPGEEGKILTFYWLTNPGVLILLAVIITTFIDALKKQKNYSVLWISLTKTFKAVKSPSILLILVVSFATIMRYSGMIKILAEQTAIATGSLYPLFSSAIGALGAFITGSSISSCILFGEFQKHVAINLGINEYWLIAANLAGGTIGKTLSPYKIAVALAAVGLYGQESKLLRKSFYYCFVFLAILGLMTFFFSGISDVIISILAH